LRQTINGADLRRLIISAAASIEIHKQALNELNVFPVPDGDTGTNMSMTIATAAAELKKSEPSSVGQAAGTTASALLRGARGNSGVILSLLFRGLSKGLKGLEEADGAAQAVQSALHGEKHAVRMRTAVKFAIVGAAAHDGKLYIGRTLHRHFDDERIVGAGGENAP